MILEEDRSAPNGFKRIIPVQDLHGNILGQVRKSDTGVDVDWTTSPDGKRDYFDPYGPTKYSGMALEDYALKNFKLGDATSKLMVGAGNGQTLLA